VALTVGIGPALEGGTVKPPRFSAPPSPTVSDSTGDSMNGGQICLRPIRQPDGSILYVYGCGSPRDTPKTTSPQPEPNSAPVNVPALGDPGAGPTSGNLLPANGVSMASEPTPQGLTLWEVGLGLVAAWLIFGR
jgi:hypothetical protein